MKKKSARKLAAKRPLKKLKKHGHYIEFFGLGVGMLIGVFAIAGFRSAESPNVLGLSVFQSQATAAPTITPTP